jgi:hypothetical protein
MNKVYSTLQNVILRESESRQNFVKSIGTVLLLVISLLSLTSGLSAQTDSSGQITGNITDSTGAIVGDATVTVTQVATGTKRTAMSSADGNFSLPNLAIGVYRLNVSKKGFKETSVQQVVVNVASVTRQNVALQIGEVSETVEITADAIQAETQTGAVGEIISGEQVRELPLNGRSFVQLTQLQPGVSAANNFDSKNKGLFSGVDFSVNGNSTQSNLFLTDGANNNDTGSNRTILLFPSIEAIAEFKSLRNAYGPEYGQASGAVITIATRGGSNKLHGTGYYFGRNDALNAAEYFAKNNKLKKDKLRRNDYGFSLGGPIVKDRLFFFYSQEFNKEIRGASRTGSVPTLNERAGNFSAPRVLASGQRCSGDPIGNGRPGSTNQIIPTSELGAAGAAIVKLFPTPNLAWSPNSTNCNNWATSANSPINFREENLRIDYNVTEKNKIFGRYTQDTWGNPSPEFLNAGLWGDDAFPTVESSWKQPSKQAAFKLSSTLSNTAINEIQFAYSTNSISVTSGVGGDINKSINQAVPGFYPSAGKVNGDNRPHPVFWGGIAPYNYGTGADLWTETPFKNVLKIYSIKDDASKVWGNHTLKTGFLYDKASKNEDSGPNNEAIQFWGGCCANNSGNYLADILTKGSLFGFNETDRQPVGKTRYSNLEFYLGDTWKVRQNLTLELGARYSIFNEPYDADNKISSFSPALYNASRPASDPCNGLIVPKGTNPCAGITGASTPKQASNRSIRATNFKNIAPRLGIAWDVRSNGKTAIRAGFGQFFLRERINPIFGGLTLNSPFAKTIGGQRTLDVIAPGTTPIFSGLSAASAGSPKYGLSEGAQTPYALQFNFSFGQQLWKDTVLEVGYVGNRSRNQLTTADLNQVKDSNRVAAAFTTSDANAVNLLRPYSNYGSIYQYERSGKSDYNSLQLLFRTKLSKNSQLQAAYTYSKSITDYSLTDASGTPNNYAILDRNKRGLDAGKSDINRPHIFVSNLIYNLPAFNGRNAFMKNVLGGWEIASIVQISSGTSLTPNINATGIQNAFRYYDSGGVPQIGTATFQGGIAGTGTGVANQRPIRVEGVPCSVVPTSGGDKTGIINPGAWTLVGYKLGQTNPQKSTCLGPGNKNVDFSFYKNFTPSWLTGSKLGEGAKIQFRLEMFNAFNTVQFRGDSLPLNFYNGTVSCGAITAVPGSGTCTAANNTITDAGTNGIFGKASKTRGPREIQYALKLVF